MTLPIVPASGGLHYPPKNGLGVTEALSFLVHGPVFERFAEAYDLHYHIAQQHQWGQLRGQPQIEALDADLASARSKLEIAAFAAVHALVSLLIEGKIVCWAIIAESGVEFWQPIPAAEWSKGKFTIDIRKPDRLVNIGAEDPAWRKPYFYTSIVDEANFTSAELKPKRRRGRSDTYDWGTFAVAMAVRIHYDGIPERQSDLERWAMEWFQDRYGAEPAESTVREKVAPYWSALKKP